MTNEKAEILRKSRKYWNPSKVEEWHKKGIDLVIGKREGYRFWDMDGAEFMDIHLNGGTYNLGHRNPEVISAMIQATEQFDVGNHHFPAIARAELAEQMAQLCPGDLNYSVFSTCGGEAIDVAIKSARYATGRKKVVSIKGCYHGHTGLAVSAGDDMFKVPFHCEGEPNTFVQVPLNDIDAMETELKKEDTACVLVETILATYGFPLPKEGYLKAVKKLCEKYGAFYVADEVQTGLMRTGRMWGIEHEGFVPDMIVTAKGFGGGVYPISATVMNAAAAKWLFEIGRLHGSTCGGSEIGCRVASKVLEITTRPSTVENVLQNQKYLKQGVEGLQKRYPGFLKSYSQRGVIMGLNFACEDASVSVVKPLYDHGVWAHNARLHPETLQLKLGLLCDRKYIDELFEKMDAGLKVAYQNFKG